MKCPNCTVEMGDGARFCGACGKTIASTQEVSHAGHPSSSTAEAPSLIGREIAGRYRVNAKLGEGGMGAVYKAEQMSLKRTVAVKLLRPEMASSQMLLARFNAEAQAVAKLSHPNTVNIYDFGQDSDGSLFIAMEFIEGRSLRHVIHNEAPLPLRRALHIASQIAASLTDAHAASIVHRDLKPDNVMLQDRGKVRDVVRVLDFGIAKLRDEGRQTQQAMTQAGDMLGTPQYMAPEQIRAEHIDGRTDVYALGCILYEMVTGRLPFEAPTVMALLSKHLLEQIAPPSQRRPDLSIPLAVDQLILAAMAKDPAARPPTMEQMGEHIHALLATLPAATGEATAQVAAQSAALSVPTPMPPSFVPHAPPPGAPQAYDPFAHRPVHAPAPVAKKSAPVVWIVLGALLLGGIGAGVYFGAIKKGTPSEGSGTEEAAAPEEDKPEPPDPDDKPEPPDPDDKPDLGSADPWSGGGGGTGGSTLPAGAVTTVQGVSVLLPTGFAVVQGTPTAWAAADVSRSLMIGVVALPPGGDDVMEIMREYAKQEKLKLLKTQDTLIAGELRPLGAFQGKVNGTDFVQAGTVLIGSSYRVGVVFYVPVDALKKDPSLGSIGDDFFAHRVFVP